MRIDRVILKNFMTFIDLDYTFVRKPLQIQGENRTDDDQKTNGVGKSGILTAVERAITASNSKGVLDKELINFNHDEAHIQVFASCDIRKEILWIHWILKRKSSNGLEIKTRSYDSDEFKDVEVSNVDDKKRFIDSWFAIAKEDLYNYYFISAEKFKSFFKSSNREKVELINRFSDASIIDKIDEIDIKDWEAKLETYKEDLTSHKATKENVEKTLLYERARNIGEEQEKAIKQIKDNIAEYQSAIQEAESDKEEVRAEIRESEKDLLKLKETLKTAEENLANFEVIDFNKERKESLKAIKSKEEEIEKIEEKIKKTQSGIDTINLAIRTHSNKLAGSIECPKCKHEFIQNDDISREERLEKLAKAKDLLPVYELQLKNEKAEKNTLNTILKTLESEARAISKKESDQDIKQRELKRAKQTVLDGIEEIKKEIKDYESDMLELDRLIERKNARIKEDEEAIKKPSVQPNDDRIKELEEEIEELDLEIASDEENVRIASDEIYKANQWKENFKRFKMYIANKSLGAIEYHCNSSLERMQSDIRIKIEGFKQKADGSIKEEITPRIIRNGVERSFNSFSGGERGRILFASILANKYMIDLTHPYGGLNFLGIDEVFEGVDSLGLKNLMKSIADFDLTVLLITHVTDEEVRSDVLKIVKENDMSFILNQ